MLGLGIGMRAGGRADRFDFTGAVLPPGATLARAGPAACTAADGTLAWRSSGVPRFDHHPVTGRPRGLLIEGEGTNLLTRSTDFAAPQWTATLVTSTAAVGPNGGPAHVLSDASVSSGSISQAVIGTPPLVASLYLRKDAVGAATRFVLVRISPAADLLVDTATGAVDSSSGLGGSIDAGAWWRVWVPVPTAPAYFQIYPAAGSGGLGSGYSAAATGSVTLWGPQLEAGGRATSPIRSEAAAGTRAADVLALDWGSRGVADGPVTLRHVFDDGSSQTRTATIVGGLAAVPTDLARPHLIAVERV